MKCRKTVAYTTNLFIALNMQQRRHVSALFYGAIFRSIMVTKEEIQQYPRGVLYIVGRLWTWNEISYAKYEISFSMGPSPGLVWLLKRKFNNPRGGAVHCG